MIHGNGIAWILGAGFSIPLGGPAFVDLISDRTVRALRHWKPYHKLDKVYDLAPLDYAETVCSIYHAGLRRVGIPGIWDDAEQFLEKLDEAAGDTDGSLAASIKDELVALKNRDFGRDKHAERAAGGAAVLLAKGCDYRVLLGESIRFVAAASTLFLDRAERNAAVVKSSETWGPYRNWFQHLQPGDTVITFNYDRTLSLLEAHCRKGFFVQPGIEQDDDLVRASLSSCVRLFHLHGQVGWRSENGVLVDAGKPVAHVDPRSAVLGVPGEGKLSLATSFLKASWRSALQCISTSSAVVFIGYRFPPTDNYAKEKLFGALHRRSAVHLVLGENSPHSRRVMRMLQWKLPGDRITDQNMYTQDFFTVFNRVDLLPQ